MVAGKSMRGMSPKFDRMRFSTFLRVPYSEGVLVLPGWPPLGGDVVAEQGPCPLEVDLSRPYRFRTATLDGTPLGLGASLGREDAGRALPLAVLIADLVALVRVSGDGGTTAIQAMYHAPLSRAPDDS